MNSESIIEFLTSARGWVMVLIFFPGSIFIHELGHFLAAKWRGLQIDRFSIGFGPRLWGWTRNGVDYRISLLPLGGYVALPQLAGMQGIEGDSAVPSNKLKDISFSDKVIVAVAGPVFNVLFALVIGTFLWQVGIPAPERSQSKEIGYITPYILDEAGEKVASPAVQAGFQIGDIISSIDGRKIENFGSIVESVALSAGVDNDGKRVVNFSVIRDGQLKDLIVYPSLNEEYGMRYIGIGAGYDVIIGEISPDSPASKTDLQSGDLILAADGQRMRSIEAFITFISERGSKEFELQIKRGTETLTRKLTPTLVSYNKDGDQRPMIGIGFDSNTILVNKSPITQVGDAVNATIRTLSALVNPKSDVGIQHMSGAVGIARIIKNTAAQDLRYMLFIVLIININLAIFNLLPIPVLDGGHITFALITKIRNKPLSPNFIASLQGSFMFILLGLMIYVTFNDVSRWSKDASDEKKYEENKVELKFEDPKTDPTPAIEQPASD